MVEKDGSGPVREIVDKYKSQRGVDYLVKISGWRATFEILISIIAALLLARRAEIKTIEFDAEQTATDQPSQ